MSYWQYRPTEYPTKGPGDYYFVVYEKTKKYRGGVRHPRIYVKRIYISGRNPQWDLTNRVRINKQGNKTRGIEVSYETKARTRGGGSTIRQYTKIIPIPRGAKNIRVETSPPMRPYMEIA